MKLLLKLLVSNGHHDKPDFAASELITWCITETAICKFEYFIVNLNFPRNHVHKKIFFWKDELSFFLKLLHEKFYPQLRKTFWVWYSQWILKNCLYELKNLRAVKEISSHGTWVFYSNLLCFRSSVVFFTVGLLFCSLCSVEEADFSSRFGFRDNFLNLSLVHFSKFFFLKFKKNLPYDRSFKQGLRIT